MEILVNEVSFVRTCTFRTDSDSYDVDPCTSPMYLSLRVYEVCRVRYVYFFGGTRRVEVIYDTLVSGRGPVCRGHLAASVEVGRLGGFYSRGLQHFRLSSVVEVVRDRLKEWVS